MTDDSHRPHPIGVSLDTLVLILVAGMTLHQDSFQSVRYITPGLNAIAVGLLGLYVVLDVLGAPLREGGRRTRRLFFGGKSAILAGIVALLVLWPTVNLIGQRHTMGLRNTVHDTSINVEEGTKFLLAGKDFYAQNYLNTPLAQFKWHDEPLYGYGPNPALWLTDTFPGQELITVPFMLASNATLHWFDERFVYMVAFALTVLLLVLLAPTASTRLALVAAVALNPIWVPTFIYGQNDILVLAEILAVIYFSGRARWRLALLCLAIGCATKQTTLLLVPFYLWWLWLRLGDTWRQRLERLALLAPWLIVPGVLMLVPFYAWDPTAFYNGNFAYVNGSVPHSYPIQGYDGWGAAGFVLWGGLVSGPNAYFPFWIMQAAVALPLALILLRRMRKDTTPATMLAAYAVALFPIFYFSRFFHASYIAFLVSLVAVAYFAHRPRWVAGPAGSGEVERRGLRDSYLSFDLVVLFLLVPQVIGPPTNRTNAIFTAIPMGLLLAYTVVAVLVPWGIRGGRASRRSGAIARAIVLAGLAQSVFFAQLTLAAADRLRWNYPAFSIRDTALQTWIGAGDLLSGQNPYSSSFMNSSLPQLYIPPYAVHAPVRPDLPLTHYPHLPLGALFSLPFQAFFSRIGYVFDQSYVYLPVILIMLVLVVLLVRRPARQVVLLCAMLFSPLFAYAAMQGQDDVLVLVPLLAALWLLQRRQLLAASLAVGVGVAFKLTAWPLVPLLLAYYAGLYRDRYQGYGGAGGGDRWQRAWSRAGEGLRRAGTVALRSWALALPVAATMIPFLRWNAQAFLSDAFAYPLGLMRNAIPLQVVWGPGFQTLGFGRVALTFGWARVNGDGYIGPYLAAVLGLLALGLLAVRLYRAPSIPLLMAGYVALLFVLEYFGRFMVDDSLGYLAVLAPLAFFLPPGPTTMAGAGRLPLHRLPWNMSRSLRWLPWDARTANAAVSPTPTDPGELVAAMVSSDTERAALSREAPALLATRLANLGPGAGNGHGQTTGNEHGQTTGNGHGQTTGNGSGAYPRTDLGEVFAPGGDTRAVDSVVTNGRHPTEVETVVAIPIAASEASGGQEHHGVDSTGPGG